VYETDKIMGISSLKQKITMVPSVYSFSPDGSGEESPWYFHI